jgi:two-component system phosphate regulon response regulator PhoB
MAKSKSLTPVDRGGLVAEERLASNRDHARPAHGSLMVPGALGQVEPDFDTAVSPGPPWSPITAAHMRRSLPSKRAKQMAKRKVLVIEDDRSLADVLAYNLKIAGYEVMLARDGNDGLRQAQLKLPEVIILDLMLPGIDGLEVCRRLRSDSTTQNLLVVMLTAKAEESDQIVGLSMGADDYVTKPFSVKVLLERIKALERRSKVPAGGSEIVSCHGVKVDLRSHTATAGDEPLKLTLSEFRLLEALVRQPGRAFTRNELITAALGDDAMVLERTIDVHIRALRDKLGPSAELIETVRGVGYRFRKD